MNSLNDYNEAMIERERQLGNQSQSQPQSVSSIDCHTIGQNRRSSDVTSRLNRRLETKHEESTRRARYVVLSIALICPSCGGQQPVEVTSVTHLTPKDLLACSNCSEYMIIPPIVGSMKDRIVTYP